jgi:hypothetical protein
MCVCVFVSAFAYKESSGEQHQLRTRNAHQEDIESCPHGKPTCHKDSHNEEYQLRIQNACHGGD